METIVERLKALSAYPIPETTLRCIAEGRGISPNGTEYNSVSFALATADVYMWLADAPDVSQGGQSYSFSEDQRKNLRAKATAIYGSAGATQRSTIYGYKGSRL